MNSLVLGITGASGAIYAVRLLQVLLASARDVHLSISPAGAEVLRQELGLAVDLDNFALPDLLPNLGEANVNSDTPQSPLRKGSVGTSPASMNDLMSQVLRSPKLSPPAEAGRAAGQVLYHHYRDLFAPIASGSSLTAGMVVCPCSGGTLSAIAHGASTNLIHRAADVHLKERRKLVLVPRETPLSLVQLDNMRACALAGAVVLPASPGFYHGVRGLTDLVDFVVARICDQLGVAHALTKRWGE